MFRYFVKALGIDPNLLFLARPDDIDFLMEAFWSLRPDENSVRLGAPGKRSGLAGKINDPYVAAFDYSSANKNFGQQLDKIKSFRPVWAHLAYALMIENTRIYEIFQRVVNEFLHGESLGAPGPESLYWLRSTEALFFRDPPNFSINSIVSHVRPDQRATRRNAYHRMFGMDLVHGKDDGSPYPYKKSNNINNEFITQFEELLREVWLGITNYANTIGARPIDDAKIANLCENIHNMLLARRVNGNLSREEYSIVAMMSWFHLTLEGESAAPIVVDLKADSAISPEQRLFLIAQRVGLPAHGLSRSYFEIADSISLILIEIERGRFNEASDAKILYDPMLGENELIPNEMKKIITHWSAITGRDLKSRKVVPN